MTTKTILKYDKDLEAIVANEVTQHNYKSYQRNRRAPERFAHYVYDDFVLAHVYDIGCSHGEMLTQAKLTGAVHTAGIEYNEVAAENARNAGHDVTTGDIDDWTQWPVRTFDVVLFLAVWKTSRFSERDALLMRAASLAEQVLYVETHRHEHYLDVFRKACFYTDMQSCRIMNFDEERYLMRFTRARSSACKAEYRFGDELFEFEEINIA